MPTALLLLSDMFPQTIVYEFGIVSDKKSGKLVGIKNKMPKVMQAGEE